MTDKHYGPHPVASLLLRVGRNYKKITSPIAYIARRFIRHSGEKLTADNRGGCCLDIGAGVAPYEKEICEAFGIESYIPVDVSASDRTKVIADGECLPFQSASVQLLVSFDVIQHLPNPEDMLRESSRVLIPGGYIILTFPFLYPECDVHDFRRWTIEGMEKAIRRVGLVPVLVERRGGTAFAVACALTWMLQHLVPGQRRTWRASHNWLGFVRAMLVAILTLPAQLLAWAALVLDCVLVSKGMYMGGAILAQKQDARVDLKGGRW